MSRKQGKAVPEGNGPVPHDQLGFGEPTMEDLYRMFKEYLDRRDKNLNRVSELTGILKATNQRLANLQHRAQQPRLAMKADLKSDMKTRKRTEGAAATDRAKHGECYSTRVDNGPTSLTSFGKIAEPPLWLLKNASVIPGQQRR